MNNHKHEHSGCTKRTFENPREVLLSAGLPAGDVLLDIGTGSGYLAITAAEIMGAAGKVFALDTHAESIAALARGLAARGVVNVSAMQADVVETIPVPRGTVDVCLMSNVLHGFAANGELDAVMKNVNKVLKEDGEIIIIDFIKADTGFGPPVPVRLSPDEAEMLIAPYGYKLLKKWDVQSSHYGLVLKRVSLQEKYC